MGTGRIQFLPVALGPYYYNKECKMNNERKRKRKKGKGKGYLRLSLRKEYFETAFPKIVIIIIIKVKVKLYIFFSLLHGIQLNLLYNHWVHLYPNCHGKQ